MKHYTRPYSIHGTPEEQDHYHERISRLNRHRGQTCPVCDATDSHLTTEQLGRGAMHYHCDNCGREFYG